MLIDVFNAYEPVHMEQIPSSTPSLVNSIHLSGFEMGNVAYE